MDTPPLPPQKKGLGPLAWIGIGCGGLVVLGIIVALVLGVVYGKKAKAFVEEAQKNPTRVTATTMVTVSGGQIEMVEQDDANKRYTVREKQSGKLTTIYWDERAHAPNVIEGDFSKIPASPAVTPEPVGAPQPK